MTAVLTIEQLIQLLLTFNGIYVSFGVAFFIFYALENIEVYMEFNYYLYSWT